MWWWESQEWVNGVLFDFEVSRESKQKEETASPSLVRFSFFFFLFISFRFLLDSDHTFSYHVLISWTILLRHLAFLPSICNYFYSKSKLKFGFVVF